MEIAMKNVMLSWAFTCTLLAAMTASATPIINGNFEAGSTGFATDYMLNTVPGLLGAGSYEVAQAVPRGWAPGFGDHTTGTGSMALYNGSTTASDRVWSEMISLSAGTTYRFDGWVADITQSIAPGAAPILQLTVNGVQQGTAFSALALDDIWQQFSFNWTATGTGTAEVALHELSAVAKGDDFAIDDLALSSVPEPSTVLLMGLGMAILGVRRRA